jgi:hypothetical protein
MREVHSHNSLFVIEVEICEEANSEVLRTLHHTHPERVALVNITDTTLSS